MVLLLRKGGDWMLLAIGTILSAKNISTSEEELKALKVQWEGIQSLKKSFEQAELDDSDIAVTHDLRGVYHE